MSFDAKVVHLFPREIYSNCHGSFAFHIFSKLLTCTSRHTHIDKYTEIIIDMFDHYSLWFDKINAQAMNTCNSNDNTRN